MKYNEVIFEEKDNIKYKRTFKKKNIFVNINFIDLQYLS